MFNWIGGIISNTLGIVAGKMFNNLGRTAERIAELKWSARNAQTEREKIASEEQIKVLEAKRDVLVSEADSPWNAITRAVFVAPIALYYAKLWIWDKMLDWGTTDPPSDEMNWIARIVISFYFIGEISRIWKK